MIECVCKPAPAPYDRLLESNPKCLAHNSDVRLVAAGWLRTGDFWTQSGCLYTKEQALEVLDGQTV